VISVEPFPVASMVTLRQIEVAVNRLMGTTPEELRSSGHGRRYVIARQMFVWIAREHTCDSYPDIAKHFGRSTHTGGIWQKQRAECHIRSGRIVAYGRTMGDLINELERTLGLPETDHQKRMHVMVETAW
jgi:hypothetical protein